MKNYTQRYKVYFIIVICFVFNSCKKQWLDEKANLSDVRPSTLKDFQAILDDNSVMNNVYAGIGLSGADNYYLTDQNYNNASQYLRNSYTWEKDIFAGTNSTDWTNGYRLVQSTNIVLDGLAGIKREAANAADYDRVKGSALFYRSYAFYTLSQLFCAPYSQATVNEPGIVLRQTSDVNEKSVRATVGETYARMLSDVREATTLLPKTSAYQMRPTRPAANALLAKISLSMENYTDALKYSGDALADFNNILDFNNSSIVSPTTTYRFPAYPGNPEILFYARQPGYTTTSAATTTLGYVDSTLYRSYDANDLRKTIYYQNSGKGKIQFRGNYAGTLTNFAGIATNEILLIHAESSARTGDKATALQDLNSLLVHRYKTGTFVALNIDDPETLLSKILEERRKELPFTGQIRWEDLRRLNKDPRFAKTLVRNIAGTRYTLAPDSKRYVFPIPDNEILLSGIPQNER